MQFRAMVTSLCASALLLSALGGCQYNATLPDDANNMTLIPLDLLLPLQPAPPPDTNTVPIQTAQVRVATFNTACIVPEMEEGLLGKLGSLTDVTIGCLDEISAFVGDVANLASIGIDAVNPLDWRDEVEDRVMDRAAQMAQYVKDRPDIDIIAFNEVFLEEARWYFVNQLSGTYPYYVALLPGDGGTVCQTEDSGLMLFSRFPFMALPSGLSPDPGVIAGANGSPWNDVAFVEFDYDKCKCEDCLAEKGAGYVRIQNPNSGDEYHVVFTHLQADPTACVWATPIQEVYDARAAQLQDIRGLINQALAPDGFAGNTNVIVMGDLNVVGTQPEAANAVGLNGVDNLEWFLKFDPASVGGHYFAGDPFANPQPSRLYDTWALTTSPHDPGVTNGSKNRLDYIFMNSAPGAISRRLAPQHLTLLGDSSMSDHLGVHAVINDFEPHCVPVDAITPQSAYALPAAASATSCPGNITGNAWPNNEIYSETIKVAGGYHWYRFDLPGTYSIALKSGSGQNETSGFDLRVYRHTDLTFDVSNYYEEETDISEYFPAPSYALFAPPAAEPIIGKVYVVPEAPFYVRISPQARDGKGAYHLFVHRHEGRKREDAIRLPANCTEEYFHGAAPLNAEDSPWFQFNIEQADSGKPQSLRFITMWDPAKGAGPMTLRLLDEAGAMILETTGALTTNPAGGADDPAYGCDQPRNYVDMFHNALENEGTFVTAHDTQSAKFFLRVKRPDLPGGAAYDAYAVRWETNLTILHGKRRAKGCNVADNGCVVSSWAYELYAGDETGTDAFGSDEIDMEFRVDGLSLPQLPYLTKNDIGGAATDMDSGDSVSLEHVLGPIRFVDSVKVIVHELDGGDIDVSGSRTIKTLAPDKANSFKHSPSMGVGSGDYEFRYNLSRSFEYVAP